MDKQELLDRMGRMRRAFEKGDRYFWKAWLERHTASVYSSDLPYNERVKAIRFIEARYNRAKESNWTLSLAVDEEDA